MSSFDIWLEGHKAQGNRSIARKIATVEACTFIDACVKFSKTQEAEGFGIFNEERLTFWGCRLFDNERDARKIFG